MKIAILGSGISGLLAAKALDDLHLNFTILTKKIEAKMAGLHYLHDNCGIKNLNKFEIHTVVYGDKSSALTLPEQYDMKLFGKVRGNNSIAKLKSDVLVYDMKQAWQGLIYKYGCFLDLPMIVNGRSIKALLNQYDYVVSTIPLYCIDSTAKCKTQLVWLTKKFFGAAKGAPIDPLCNKVIYNLHLQIPWHRSSSIQGEQFTEYKDKPKHTESVKVLKVISVDNYQPKHPNLILAGREGEWNRQRLAHEVYYNIFGKFKEILTKNA